MRKIIRIVPMLLIITILFIGINSLKTLNITKNNKNTLININDYSNKEMDKYLADIEKINSGNNQENVLIIISKYDIKDDFGAINVVKAPNHQYFLEYETTEEKNKALNNFKKDNKIISVEENIFHTISETTYNSWGVEAQSLDTAINVANSASLASVTVAVIDTGCNVTLFNNNFSSKLAGVYNVLTNSTSTSSMSDEIGHGTHIAGTIAEATPKNVKVYPVKVADEKSMDTVKIITAINYITRYQKADVINMSFGSYGVSESERQAIESAKQNNIITVAAAGNDNLSTEMYPAAFDNTISVASVDSSLNKSTFSNYGSTIDFAAPGTSIKSINGIMSGTSMATPHAASAVAILKGYNKNLTLADTKELLKQNAIDLGDIGWDQEYGNGFISFKNVEFCTGNVECDNYNVYKATNKVEKTYSKIDLNETNYTSYNYGSLTNILGTKVRVTYTDNTKETKYLWELENITINNYDPYSTENQNIEIVYTSNNNEKTLTIPIKNPTNYEIGWEYNIVDSTEGKIELTSYKISNTSIEKLYLPEEIDNYEVIGISDFDFNNNIFNSKYNNISYKELYLPSQFQYLGKNSLSGTEIKTIKGDINNLKIGDYALKDSKLSNINVPISSIGISSFEQTNIKTIQFTNEINTIPNSAFKNTYYLEDIEIPSDISIDSIGESAFENSHNLKEFDLSIVKNSIGSKAFYHCNNLSTINLTASSEITSIGSYAFSNTKISNVELPDGLTSLKTCTFYNCSSLKTITLNSNLRTIESNSLSNTNLSRITIPSKVTSIANDFLSYAPVRYITVESENTLYDSRDNSNAIIETYTNKLIKGSASTTIPNTVTSIDQNAFLGNTLLQRMTIPDSINSIGSMAFSSCVNLTVIYLPNKDITYGTNVFKNDSSLVMHVYKATNSKTYAVDNSIKYKHLDPDEIKVNIEGNTYTAKTKINTSSVVVTLKYNEDSVREETLDITNCSSMSVKYMDETKTSLEYGDTYFTLFATTSSGYKIEKQVRVKVVKATPSYTVPTNLTALVGQKLSEISLPSNFEWMNGNTYITYTGSQTYKAKYVPDDTKNYETITNINVEVNVKNTTVIQNIEMNTSKRTIEIGDTYILSANIYPSTASNKTITWSSSDSSIARVDSTGKVTGLKEGIAIITATTSNNKTSTCEVTVQKGILKISYSTHIQSYGWQNYVYNGKMSGTSGQAKRLEAIKIKLKNQDYTGNVEYRTHIQSYGWETYWKRNDNISGKVGESKRLEAIQIRLTGEMAEHYDVYYRVHAQKFGWLGWARNGESAGTEGYAYRLEGIEIILIEKGTTYYNYGTSDAFKEKQILYTTHVQSYGWQGYAFDGGMSGTSGEGKRLEAIKIKLNSQKETGNIEYETHIQSRGWETSWKRNDQMSGTSGEAKRLEAIKIRLTGNMATYYDVYYRVHAQSFGWLTWAKNGDPAGTAGYAKRLEGIEIVLVKKGESPPTRNNTNNYRAFIEKK